MGIPSILSGCSPSTHMPFNLTPAFSRMALTLCPTFPAPHMTTGRPSRFSCSVIGNRCLSLSSCKRLLKLCIIILPFHYEFCSSSTEHFNIGKISSSWKFALPPILARGGLSVHLCPHQYPQSPLFNHSPLQIILPCCYHYLEGA